MDNTKIIPISEPDLNGNENRYVNDCLKSTWISSLGKYNTEFERKFSEYNHVKRSVAVFNGTVALHLALITLGIGHGDEVIVPDLTFVATANVVSHTTAKAVLVDVDKKSWNIDINKIEKNITNKTKAIMPVHLYGNPCDMDPIMDIAKKHNLYVIEDVAQATGAEYKGKKLGSIGDIGCFSFYGNKIITTGEGGMCITNNEKYADKMAFLANHAMSNEKKYWHTEIGYNYRMTNIQAAIGLAQLERIDEFIDIKRKNSELYNKLLCDVKGIQLPSEEKWAKNVYWMYSIISNNREKIAANLKKENIDTRPFFHSLHTMSPYKREGDYAISEELSMKGLSLPSSTKLTRHEIERIAEIIKNVA